MFESMNPEEIEKRVRENNEHLERVMTFLATHSLSEQLFEYQKDEFGCYQVAPELEPSEVVSDITVFYAHPTKRLCLTINFEQPLMKKYLCWFERKENDVDDVLISVRIGYWHCRVRWTKDGITELVHQKDLGRQLRDAERKHLDH